MDVICQLHILTALSPGKEPLSTSCIGGFVDPRASLDTMEKRKMYWPCQEYARKEYDISMFLYFYDSGWDWFFRSSLFMWTACENVMKRMLFTTLWYTYSTT